VIKITSLGCPGLLEPSVILKASPFASLFNVRTRKAASTSDSLEFVLSVNLSEGEGVHQKVPKLKMLQQRLSVIDLHGKLCLVDILRVDG
jgi:hypothetical protein